MFYILGLIFLVIFLLLQFRVIRIVEKFGCGCRYCNYCTGNLKTCPIVNMLNENFNNLSPNDWNTMFPCPLCEKKRRGTGLNRFMTWRLGLGKWAGDIDGLQDSDSMKFYRGDPSKCPIRKLMLDMSK